MQLKLCEQCGCDLTADSAHVCMPSVVVRRTFYGHLPDGIKNDQPQHEAVNHPKHYTSHPSGVECIQITEHFGFNLGNVIKYLWRAEEKGAPLEDLRKARWYLDREIQKREGK